MNFYVLNRRDSCTVLWARPRSQMNLTFTEQDPDLASGGQGLNEEPLRKPNMCTQDSWCASWDIT